MKDEIFIVLFKGKYCGYTNQFIRNAEDTIRFSKSIIEFIHTGVQPKTIPTEQNKYGTVIGILDFGTRLIFTKREVEPPEGYEVIIC